MSQYKDTLNLPRTAFPMKANLPVRERDILEKWGSINLFEKIKAFGQGKEKFIFHDGPPYANGHIHMGTAVNKTLKDMVVKSKNLSGFTSTFVPGWDCHGLPIELNVEKKVGKPGHKISKTAFRQACRDYANTQINFQREEFKRLGIQADWENPYLTMDFTFEANEIRSLSKIIQNGHLQKGEKPIYWCLDCSSALAEAEVEYADKTSPAIDVRFQVDNESDFIAKFDLSDESHGPISIPIWTTTPWTLPANMAVMLSPEVEYHLVECDGKERLLLAPPLIDVVMQRYEVKSYKTIGKILGRSLENTLLQHPLYERQVPVILADFVTVDSGTGAVHAAGAHGPDDYVATQKYGIPLINLLGDDGCFFKDTPLIGGQHVTKVNDVIIDALKSQHKLLHVTSTTHSYPVCWRHKTPVIFRATPQWFISMDKNNLRAQALQAISRVNWIPEWGHNRIYSMIEHRPDWCISRQRTWGVPIAIFYHKETGVLHPDTPALMEKVAQQVEKEGIEAWFALDPAALLDEKDLPDYEKCLDVLDVWFDSGLTHECVLKKRSALGFPADLYLEGSDQHRGWFHSSLLTSIAINNKEPYRAVLTHGYVIDLQGRKMSKSLGNVIAPETIIQSLGADILRLWVASIDYRGDIFISDEILSRTADTYRRIRNTARFILANLAGFNPETDLVPVENLLSLDLYITDKTHALQEEITQAYNAYQFHIIYQKIHQFCSVDLGSFYLDIIKDRQYTTRANSLARRSTQTALFHIIEALVRWMAPIVSFTAEEIWQHIPGTRNESVFLNTWYQGIPTLFSDSKMDKNFWEKMRLIRDATNSAIENLRNSGELGSSLEAAVEIYCDQATYDQLILLENELRFVLITSSAEVFLSDHLNIVVKSLKEKIKCERCWHRTDDIGLNKDYETLCGRCIDNVTGEGEVRQYA